MKVKSLRLVGIRCFEDTRSIEASPTCNIFVGTNNTGKSTLLRGLLSFQGFPFTSDDVRPGSIAAFYEMVLVGVKPTHHIRHRPRPIGNFSGPLRVVRDLRRQPPAENNTVVVPDDSGAFMNTRPHHTIVPFIARRKALAFSHDITLGNQSKLTGTFSNLYSRIDLLATAGQGRLFRVAVNIEAAATAPAAWPHSERCAALHRVLIVSYCCAGSALPRNRSSRALGR